MMGYMGYIYVYIFRGPYNSIVYAPPWCPFHWDTKSNRIELSSHSEFILRIISTSRRFVHRGCPNENTNNTVYFLCLLSRLASIVLEKVVSRLCVGEVSSDKSIRRARSISVRWFDLFSWQRCLLRYAPATPFGVSLSPRLWKWIHFDKLIFILSTALKGLSFGVSAYFLFSGWKMCCLCERVNFLWCFAASSSFFCFVCVLSVRQLVIAKSESISSKPTPEPTVMLESRSQ